MQLSSHAILCRTSARNRRADTAVVTWRPSRAAEQGPSESKKVIAYSLSPKISKAVGDGVQGHGVCGAPLGRQELICIVAFIYVRLLHRTRSLSGALRSRGRVKVGNRPNEAG